MVDKMSWLKYPHQSVQDRGAGILFLESTVELIACPPKAILPRRTVLIWSYVKTSMTGHPVSTVKLAARTAVGGEAWTPNYGDRQWSKCQLLVSRKTGGKGVAIFHSTCWAHLISKSKMLQNPELFECWHNATSGKFHTWSHVMDHSQNTDTLKILDKIMHMLYKKHTWILSLDWVPIPKISQ